MIEKQKIIDKVQAIVEKNKLDRYFLPIIEEFFCRAVDQYNWNEDDLNKYINRFDKVNNIQWHNFWERKALIFQSKTNTGRTETNIKNKRSEILMDVDYLKGILSFSEDIMEQFINTVMHEVGHIIQTEIRNSYIHGYDKGEDKNTYYYTGFRTDIIDAEDTIILSNTGTIANEYAEIINARRLQNGNIAKKTYIGYKEIQNAGKIMLSSLGITEIEYSSFQLEDKAE